MSVVEQVFGNLLVVESDVPDIWDFRHLASRQPPNVGTCEAYNASKWLFEFNCVMLTIAPGMNAVPTAPSGNNLALCSSECDELHNAELGNLAFQTRLFPLGFFDYRDICPKTFGSQRCSVKCGS